jgi:two-component system response regulator
MRADARTKRLPVVILTTSSEEADVIGGYDLGANSYVRKPVDFAQFTGSALQFGLYWPHQLASFDQSALGVNRH